MNPNLGAILLGFLSLPIIFQLYFGYAVSYMFAYLMPCPVEDNAEFDFIVVGAGSAGSVVAGRLAEAGHQVLLVEAGGPSNWIQSIPGLVLASQQTPYDWAYKTEPQEHSMGAMNNRQSAWPRGKVLGGSSMLNYMLYVRGNPKDYDEWESFGNPGWGYKDVLPFFKKSENFHRSEADPKYHGTGGPLGVLEGRDYPEISKIFLEAGKEMGYTVGDYNGDAADKETLYIGQMSVKDGKRTGTYQAFAEPFVGRGLTVLTFAHVTKISVDQERKLATGVELQRFGQKFKIKARKEVILSAGAVASPQILMLSGIGPKEHLQSHEISVVQDLPGVGQNLQDHLMAGFTILSPNDQGQAGMNVFDSVNPLKYMAYLTSGTGPLASSGITIGGFLQTGHGQDPRPDIQIHTFPGLLTLDYDLAFRKGGNVADQSYEGVYGPYKDADGGMVLPTLLRPKSRGFIKLRTSNPFDHPIIQPNYLQEPEDIQTFVAGMRLGLKFTETKAFKDNNLSLVLDKHHCGQFEPLSDDGLECIIRHWSTTVYHHSSTCKMGPKTDPMAVVDAELRIHGVLNLRVIDASIMPTIVSGNTNAPTIMIGEKGASMILQSWKVERSENSFRKEEL